MSGALFALQRHFFTPQNAATESGNAGIEIVLGERFPSVTVFGLSLARGGHQTMKRSVRPTIGVKLSLATRPSILAEESCVT